MEILLLFIQIPFLVVLMKYLRKIHHHEGMKGLYYYLLSLKVTAGLFLGILYMNYYQTGDTIFFFRELELLSNLAYTNFRAYNDLLFFNEGSEQLLLQFTYASEPRTFLFIRLISPLHLLSGGNYWLLSIYLSFFSFAGFWILSDTLLKIYKLNVIAVLISFFIFPSVVFWSSGLIKESLVMGMFCYVLAVFINVINRSKKRMYVPLLVSFFFCASILLIKFYYFAVLFAVLVPYGIIKFNAVKGSLEKKSSVYRILLFFGLLILTGYLATFFHPFLRLEHLADMVYLNYNSTLDNSLRLNVYTFEALSSNPTSFLPHIPLALIYGLFGPFLWHAKKLIMLLTGIENTLLLLFFITFIGNYFRKESWRSIDIEGLALVIYISFLAILMAFASPNWGTLMRYKIGYLPFFLIVMIHNNRYLIQFFERIPFLKKISE